MDSETDHLKYIGRGAYGIVHEILDRDLFHSKNDVQLCSERYRERPTAVKYIPYVTDAQWSNAQKELETMKTLTHRNIVRLFGDTTGLLHGSLHFVILMELCDKKTLAELVMDSKIIYSMKTVINWAVQLFGALRYLFEKHKLVHRDIRPHNIFVKSIPKRNAPYTLKLGDFGFAKVVERTCGATVATSTRYASPPSTNDTNDTKDELVGQCLKAQSCFDSHRNDVYSLGLILWEIVERRVALERFNRSNGWEFDRDRLIKEIFQPENKYMEHEPPNCQKDLQQLISSCLSLDHTKRPSATSCFQRLKKIKTELEKLPAFRLLAQFPSEGKELTGCIRPIGYNRTSERIYAQKKRLAAHEQRQFEKYLKSLNDQRFIDKGLGQKLASEIVRRYNDLSNEEKILMIGTFSQLIRMKARLIFLYQERAVIDEKWKKCEDVFFEENSGFLDEKNIEKLFESMIVHDISVLIKKLGHFFELLDLNQSGQITAEMLSDAISDLEEFAKVRFVTFILFPCYFQKSKDKEWLLIGDFSNSKRENRFVNADLREIRDFDGIWFSDGTNNHFCIRNEDKEISREFSNHDELRFLRLAPAPFQCAIKILKDILEILTKPIVGKEMYTPLMMKKSKRTKNTV